VSYRVAPSLEQREENSSHVGAQYLSYAATVYSEVTLAPRSVHKHLRFAAGAAWVRSILGCARNELFSKSYGAQGSNDATW